MASASVAIALCFLLGFGLCVVYNFLKTVKVAEVQEKSKQLGQDLGEVTINELRAESWLIVQTCAFWGKAQDTEIQENGSFISF